MSEFDDAEAKLKEKVDEMKKAVNADYQGIKERALKKLKLQEGENKSR